MTQEEKQLLLRDLCTRLPYGVILHIEFYDLQGDGKLASRDIELTPGNIAYCFNNGHWVSVKPYLRLMSSMTDEEAAEFEILSDKLLAEADNTKIWNSVIDWLNEHHFDHRGLIEKGLALEAPEGMYNN